MPRLPTLVQLATRGMQGAPVGYAGMPNPWLLRAQEEVVTMARQTREANKLTLMALRQNLRKRAAAIAALRLELAERKNEIITLRQDLEKAKEGFVELHTEKQSAEESANAPLATQQMQQQLENSEAELVRLRRILADSGIDQDQDTQSLRTELVRTTRQLQEATSIADQALKLPRDSMESVLTLRDQVADLTKQVVQLEAEARDEADRTQADSEEAAELIRLREQVAFERARANRLQAAKVIEEIAEDKAVADFERDTKIWNLSIEQLHTALDVDNARRVLQTDLTMEDPDEKEELLQQAITAYENNRLAPIDADQFWISVFQFGEVINDKTKLSTRGREQLSRRHVWDMFRALIASMTARPPNLTNRELATDRFLLAVAALPSQVFTEFTGTFDNFLGAVPHFPDIFDGDVATNPRALSEETRQHIINLEQEQKPLQKIDEKYFVGDRVNPGMRRLKGPAKFEVARNTPLDRRNMFRTQYKEEAKRIEDAIERAEAKAEQLAESALNKQIYERWKSIWRVLFDWGDKYYPTNDPWMKYMLNRWQGRQAQNPTAVALSTYLLVEPEGPERFFYNRSDSAIKEHQFGFKYQPPRSPDVSAHAVVIDKLLSKEELRGLLYQLKKQPRPVYLTYMEEKAKIFEAQGVKRATYESLVNEVPQFAKLMIERVEHLLTVVDKANEALKAGNIMIPPPSPWAQKRLNFTEREQLQANLDQLDIEMNSIIAVRAGQAKQEVAAREGWEANVRLRGPLSGAIQNLRVTDAKLERTRNALEATSKRLEELRDLNGVEFDANAAPPEPSQEGLRERVGPAVDTTPLPETPKTISQIRKLESGNPDQSLKLPDGLLDQFMKRLGKSDDDADGAAATAEDEARQTDTTKPDRPAFLGELQKRNGQAATAKDEPRTTKPGGQLAFLAELKKQNGQAATAKDEPRTTKPGGQLAFLAELKKQNGQAATAKDEPRTTKPGGQLAFLAELKKQNGQAATAKDEPKTLEGTAADVRWLAGVQRVVGQGKNRQWMVPLW